MVSLRPYSATALYAISVARRMSSSAPVDTRPEYINSSAARPPSRVTSLPRNSSTKSKYLSSAVGGVYVNPRAPPDLGNMLSF